MEQAAVAPELERRPGPEVPHLTSGHWRGRCLIILPFKSKKTLPEGAHTPGYQGMCPPLLLPQFKEGREPRPH